MREIKKERERIAYDLDLQVLDSMAFRIVDTVAKLPNAVQKFVIENVQFQMVSNCMIPRRDIKKKYVVFLKNGCSVHVVAHEIAHAYLKHATHVPVELWERQEKEANGLARKWLRG